MPLNLPFIRSRRKRMHLTMAEAGTRAGYTSNPGQRWQDIESGRYPDPQLSTVEGIARALRVSVPKVLRPVRKTHTHL